MKGISVKEIRASGIGIGALVLYTTLVLISGKINLADFANLLTRYLAGAFGLWVIIGLAGLICLLIKHRPRGGKGESPFAVTADWIVARWRRDWLVSLIWPPLLFATLMASFNGFKQMILRDAAFAYDPLFAQLDRVLFFGLDPWRLTHGIVASPWASYMLDNAYHGWFVPMSLGVILCGFLPASTWRLRTQYLLSYIAVWVGIGSVLAYLTPAAGPCFYSTFVGPAPDFDPLMAKLAVDQAAIAGSIPGTKLAALSNQAMLLAVRGSNNLAVGGGISAMPSVHNALAVLFALAGFSINRWAGWVMSVYAALIWIGSIHLGWHYAVDGIAAALLTILIWKATGHLADRLERSAPPIIDAAPIAAG